MSVSPQKKDSLEVTEFEDCFYQGYYHQSLPDGKGIIIYKNGDCYYGEFDESVMRGKGYYFPAMGGMIEGQFDDHFANGFCTVQFASGDSYKGFLKDGQLYGKGIQYTRGSDTWTYSMFEHGEPLQMLYSGDGEPINIEVNVEADGIMVTNLKMNQDLQTSESYEGQMKNGLKHGLGIMRMEDQSRILGVWYENNLHGLGIKYDVQGLIEVGKFENGELNGFGRKVEPAGTVYIGEFEDNEPCGEGVLLDKSRKKMNFGYFKRGRLVERRAEDESLDLEVNRGITRSLRKQLAASIVAPRSAVRSPDSKQFIHKIQEIVHSKVIAASEFEKLQQQQQQRAPMFVGQKERRLAKQFKQRMESDMDRIQGMAPLSQADELLKLAKDLLLDTTETSPFHAAESSRSPVRNHIANPDSWDVWERFNQRSPYEKNNEGTFGWLLSTEDPHAKPMDTFSGANSRKGSFNTPNRHTPYTKSTVTPDQFSTLRPNYNTNDPGYVYSPQDDQFFLPVTSEDIYAKKPIDQGAISPTSQKRGRPSRRDVRLPMDSPSEKVHSESPQRPPRNQPDLDDTPNSRLGNTLDERPIVMEEEDIQFLSSKPKDSAMEQHGTLHDDAAKNSAKQEHIPKRPNQAQVKKLNKPTSTVPTEKTTGKGRPGQVVPSEKPGKKDQAQLLKQKLRQPGPNKSFRTVESSSVSSSQEIKDLTPKEGKRNRPEQMVSQLEIEENEGENATPRDSPPPSSRQNKRGPARPEQHNLKQVESPPLTDFEPEKYRIRSGGEDDDPFVVKSYNEVIPLAEHRMTEDDIEDLYLGKTDSDNPGAAALNRQQDPKKQQAKLRNQPHNTGTANKPSSHDVEENQYEKPASQDSHENDARTLDKGQKSGNKRNGTDFDDLNHKGSDNYEPDQKPGSNTKQALRKQPQAAQKHTPQAFDQSNLLSGEQQQDEFNSQNPDPMSKEIEEQKPKNMTGKTSPKESAKRHSQQPPYEEEKLPTDIHSLVTPQKDLQGIYVGNDSADPTPLKSLDGKRKPKNSKNLPKLDLQSTQRQDENKPYKTGGGPSGNRDSSRRTPNRKSSGPPEAYDNDSVCLSERQHSHSNRQTPSGKGSQYHNAPTTNKFETGQPKSQRTGELLGEPAQESNPDVRSSDGIELEEEEDMEFIQFSSQPQDQMTVQEGGDAGETAKSHNRTDPQDSRFVNRLPNALQKQGQGIEPKEQQDPQQQGVPPSDLTNEQEVPVSTLPTNQTQQTISPRLKNQPESRRHDASISQPSQRDQIQGQLTSPEDTKRGQRGADVHARNAGDSAPQTTEKNEEPTSSPEKFRLVYEPSNKGYPPRHNKGRPRNSRKAQVNPGDKSKEEQKSLASSRPQSKLESETPNQSNLEDKDVVQSSPNLCDEIEKQIMQEKEAPHHKRTKTEKPIKKQGKTDSMPVFYLPGTKKDNTSDKGESSTILDRTKNTVPHDTTGPSKPLKDEQARRSNKSDAKLGADNRFSSSTVAQNDLTAPTQLMSNRTTDDRHMGDAPDEETKSTSEKQPSQRKATVSDNGSREADGKSANSKHGTDTPKFKGSPKKDAAAQLKRGKKGPESQADDKSSKRSSLSETSKYGLVEQTSRRSTKSQISKNDLPQKPSDLSMEYNRSRAESARSLLKAEDIAQAPKSSRTKKRKPSPQVQEKRRTRSTLDGSYKADHVPKAGLRGFKPINKSSTDNLLADEKENPSPQTYPHTVKGDLEISTNSPPAKKKKTKKAPRNKSDESDASDSKPPLGSSKRSTGAQKRSGSKGKKKKAKAEPKKSLDDTASQKETEISIHESIAEQPHEEEDEPVEEESKYSPEVAQEKKARFRSLFNRHDSIPKVKEEEEEEDSYDDLKKFTNYLKKGYWNYFNSPIVIGMQQRQSAREEERSSNPRKFVYYPIHDPCKGEDVRSSRSYSPKMYQNVFGDMTQSPERVTEGLSTFGRSSSPAPRHLSSQQQMTSQTASNNNMSSDEWYNNYRQGKTMSTTAGTKRTRTEEDSGTQGSTELPYKLSASRRAADTVRKSEFYNNSHK